MKFAINFCLILIVAIFVMITTNKSVFAQSVGIKFANMPIGTAAHYRDSRGRKWVAVYKGKKGKFYVVETRFPTVSGEKGNVSYYTKDGHEHRRVYPNGNIRTFTPIHCMKKLGACLYAYNNSGGSSGNGEAELKKFGKTYKYKFRDVGNARFSRVSYKLGQYNFISWLKNGDYTMRLVKITN